MAQTSGGSSCGFITDKRDVTGALPDDLYIASLFVGDTQQLPAIGRADRRRPFSSQHGGLGAVLVLPQPPQWVSDRLDADDVPI